MPPVTIDPAKVKRIENAIAFHRWLSVHRHEEDEVWIRMLQGGLGPEVDHTVHNTKTVAGRKKKIAASFEMLKR